MRFRLATAGFVAAAALAASAGMALANDVGVPTPWGTGFLEPVTPVAERLQSQSYTFHVIATLITLFVTALLAYTCWRFSEKRNPTPNRFSHNTAVEVAWTIIPVMILTGMAAISVPYLYYQETSPPANLTVKAIGHQWYWEYMYVIDGEEVYVDSNMLGAGYADYDEMVAGMKADGAADEEIPSREMWKMAATAPMVVPVDSYVTVQTTSTDVLHAFAVPSFGVKVDAVPGRLNETWFKVNEGKEGIYYGQCSELCGKDHSYMPIMVEVVSKQEFADRLSQIKEEYAARTGKSAVKVASAAAVD